MPELNSSELFRLGIGFISYSVAIISFIFGFRYLAINLRNDYTKLNNQVEIIGEKVDLVTESLSVIKANAARHDERAANIQQHVISIDGRVTFLERKGN